MSKRACLLVAFIALSGCERFHEPQKPIATVLQELGEPRQIQFCRCDGSKEAENLSLQLWPEIKRRLLAIEPDPEGVAGSWQLRGRLIVTFADASELYIDFDQWPDRFGPRVFSNVYWIPSKGRYQFDKGDEFFAWYLSATGAAK